MPSERTEVKRLDVAAQAEELGANWSGPIGPLILATGFCFAAVVPFVEHPFAHTWLGWVSSLFWAAYFVLTASDWWKKARIVGLVRGSDFDTPRLQIRDWKNKLTVSGQNSSSILQLRKYSFWTGYFDYRLLKVPQGWLVATLRKGSGRIAALRFVAPEDVQVTSSISGKMNLKIGKKTIRGVTPASEIAQFGSFSLIVS